MMKLKMLILFVLCVFSCSDHSPDDLLEPQITTDDMMSDDMMMNDDIVIPPAITYTMDVAPIMNASCVSCHGSMFPSGNLSLTNYAEVRESVENGNTIDRISRQPGDPLLMPQSGALPQATIDIILQWQTDGFQQ